MDRDCISGVAEAEFVHHVWVSIRDVGNHDISISDRSENLFSDLAGPSNLVSAERVQAIGTASRLDYGH